MKKLFCFWIATFFLCTINGLFANATDDLWAGLKQADYAKALSAIAAGADVNADDPAFGSPLNFASCWADVEVVQALLDAKATLNYIAAANGYSPLMNAAAWGNIPVVKILLAGNPDMHVRNKLGQTTLAVAMGSGKVEIIDMLIKAGANPLEKYDILATKDQTLLNALLTVMYPKAKIENLKSIQTTLAGMGITFPPRLINATENDYSTPGELAELLLENGLDPNQTVQGGWGNILNQAIDMGKYDVALQLITHGATTNPDLAITVKNKGNDNAVFPNVEYTNGDYLLVAVISGNLEFVKFMAEKYPDLIHKKYDGKGFVKCNSDKITANFTIEGVNLLMIAAEHGNLAIVQYFFEKGFDKDDFVEAKWDFVSKKQGTCPMLTVRRTMGYAKSSGNQEIMDLIKSAGGKGE